MESVCQARPLFHNTNKIPFSNRQSISVLNPLHGTEGIGFSAGKWRLTVAPRMVL
jgi:hypothetical protein